MVVLGLEAQIPLHVDLDFRQGVVEVLPELRDVVLDQDELAVGLWEYIIFGCREGDGTRQVVGGDSQADTYYGAYDDGSYVKIV